MQVDQNWRAKLPAETQLLLCYAHARSSEANFARMRDLLRGDLAWGDVLADAADHHLETLLYENLKRADSASVPAMWMALFREYTSKTAGLALFHSSELLRIADLFAQEGIPLIPYKGPVLASLAYANVTLRRFVDLDFFTEQQYIPRTAALLKSAGYEAKFGRDEERAGRRGYALGQYAFTRDRRLHVEVHTERTLRYFPRPLVFEEMQPRLIEVNVAGRVVRTFSVEDSLVMLCVHGVKHFWERLSWVVDVAELVGSHRVKWPLALEIAGKLDCTRPVLLGVALAHELLEAPIAPEILEQARLDANVRNGVRQLRENFCNVAGPCPGVWRRAKFRFALRQRSWQGIRHMARLTLAPTESDREEVRLPRALSPLYFLVRPWRLVRMYGTGLVPSAKTDFSGYLPMPPAEVNWMLEFAGVGANDVLYDLGCGDGRIVIAAAKKFGIRAVGIDIDSRRIAQANANARRHGVQDRIQFIKGDVRNADLKEATVITVYLDKSGTLRLGHRIRPRLQPGARVVSCGAEIAGWPWDEKSEYRSRDGDGATFYLWRAERIHGESAPLDTTSAGPR